MKRESDAWRMFKEGYNAVIAIQSPALAALWADLAIHGISQCSGDLCEFHTKCGFGCTRLS